MQNKIIIIATVLITLSACQIKKVDPNYCTDDGCPDFYKEDVVS